MAEERKQRKIKIETRHGSARESRSRKDRPCDACRARKSACVIAIKPPCRFCKIRGLECSFTTTPQARPRHKLESKTEKENEIQKAQNEGDAQLSPFQERSPQESRFPIPRPAFRHGPDKPSSIASSGESPPDIQIGVRRSQYLSLEQLTSPSSASEYPRARTRTQQTIVRDIRRINSLEYGKNLTAHFIGLVGEQDTNLLSSIRYNILNESKFIDFNLRQVYSGNPTQGRPPIHFSIFHDVFSDQDMRVRQEASDSIEALAGLHGDALFRLYFQFVHPILPILSKKEAVKAYSEDKFSIPASLRGSIYGLACSFWSQDPQLADHPPISEVELFAHAHAALNRELDSPKLSTLQACLLVIHQQPAASGTAETPRIWVLACQASACAQSLGLHQDPSSWKIPLWEKRLRRKLWWATYVTDQFTAVSHGNNPHLPLGSFDTAELEMDDLAEDEDVTGNQGEKTLAERDRTFNKDNARRFLEIIGLASILGGVISTAFTLSSYRDSILGNDIEASLATIWQYKISIDQSLLLLPPSLSPHYRPRGEIRSLNGTFHLAFFAVKFLVLRALMTPATPEAKSDPTSRLRHHFEIALKEGENFVNFASEITGNDMHTFWTRHARTNLIIAGNFLLYLFFCASTKEQVAKAYDMLQKYQEILVGLKQVSDWTTIGIIRPSLLRTESFFQGAAEGIRLSGRRE